MNIRVPSCPPQHKQILSMKLPYLSQKQPSPGDTLTFGSITCVDVRRCQMSGGWMFDIRVFAAGPCRP
eukprot:scaffold148199_cov79-Cyclotella_meneghiniana.AAC.3